MGAIATSARFTAFLCIGVSAAVAGGGGTPELTQHSTLAAFLDAAGELSIVEDFETAGPRDQLITTLTRPVGTWTPLAGEPFANIYIISPGATNFGVSATQSTVLTANGNEEWRLDFASPVRAFGFDTYLNTSGPGTLMAFGTGGNLLGTFTQSHDPTQVGYLGITSDTDIAAIQYVTVNGRQVNTGIDNIRVLHDALPPRCRADIGMAGGIPGHDGRLDNNDFIAFINYFFAADAHADVGVQGGVEGHDGQFDNNDFIAFITQFFAGCA